MSVASKNLFDLLGNDADGDSDSPAAPVKTVDKTSTHTAKRNTDGAAPAKPAPSTGAAGGRRGGFTGSEAAFRDRTAGGDRNRGRNPEEGAARGGARGGRGARGRGGRGATFHDARNDRHSKGVASGGSAKQADQAWGATEGDAELKDEQAGEDIAQTDQKEAAAEVAAPEDIVEEEPEEKQVSYSEFLAQQAEKKLALSEGAPKPRKANEGVNSKDEKKWAAAKALVKEEEDAFIAAQAGKAKRERERKVKQVVELDDRFYEPAQSSEGRGGRGGRGRGGDRGSRGGGRGGGDRGDGPRGGRGGGRGGPRGDFRGGRGGDGRGGGRGGQDPRGPRDAIKINDENAFPSLG